MPIVFEEPPAQEGLAARFRERSPERKEMDDMLTQLAQYPDQWARLYDFDKDDKEGAEKHAGKVRSAAGYLNTGKAWSVAVRETGRGWSVYARMSSEPARKRVRKDKGAETQAQQPEAVQGNATAPEPEQVREPTFQ